MFKKPIVWRILVPFLSNCVLAFLIIGCSSSDQGKAPAYYKISGPTQGTSYHITFSEADGIEVKNAVDSLLSAFDQSASQYVSSSYISRFNSGQFDTIKFDDNHHLGPLLLRSSQLMGFTNNSFHLGLAPILQYWGFSDKKYLEAEVDSNFVDSLIVLSRCYAQENEDSTIIRLTPGFMLDLNAIAQGYSVDLVGDLLEKNFGIDNYLVEIGGELLSKGLNPLGREWSIGVEEPIEGALPGKKIVAKVRLNNCAMATSGNYRNFYKKDGKKYSHTIDPATGFPVKHGMLSTTVLSTDAATADALATALMVMGSDKAKSFVQKNKLKAYFIFDQNGSQQVWYSDGFKGLIVD